MGMGMGNECGYGYAYAYGSGFWVFLATSEAKRHCKINCKLSVNDARYRQVVIMTNLLE